MSSRHSSHKAPARVDAPVDFGLVGLKDLSDTNFQNILDQTICHAGSPDDGLPETAMIKQCKMNARHQIDQEERELDRNGPGYGLNRRFGSDKPSLEDVQMRKSASAQVAKSLQKNPVETTLGSNGSSKASSHASDESEETENYRRMDGTTEIFSSLPDNDESGRQHPRSAVGPYRVLASPELRSQQDSFRPNYIQDNPGFARRNGDADRITHYPRSADYIANEHPANGITYHGASGSLSDPQPFTNGDADERVAKKKQGRRGKVVATSLKYQTVKPQTSTAIRERYDQALKKAFITGANGQEDINWDLLMEINRSANDTNSEASNNRRSSQAEIGKSRSRNNHATRKTRSSDSDLEANRRLMSEAQEPEPQNDTSTFHMDYQVSRPESSVSAATQDVLQRSVSGSSNSSDGKEAATLSPVVKTQPTTATLKNGQNDTIDTSSPSNKKKKPKKKKMANAATVVMASQNRDDTSESSLLRNESFASSDAPDTEIKDTVSSQTADTLARSPNLLRDQSPQDNEFQLVVARKVPAKFSPPGKPYHNYNHNVYASRTYTNNVMSGKNRSSQQPSRPVKAPVVAPVPMEFPALRRRNSAGDIKKGVLDPAPSGLEVSGDQSDKDSVRSMPVSNRQPNGANQTTSAPTTRQPTPGISYADIAKGAHNDSVKNGTAKSEGRSDRMASEKLRTDIASEVTDNHACPGMYSQSSYPENGESTNIHTLETYGAVLKAAVPLPPLAPRQAGVAAYHRSEILALLRDETPNEVKKPGGSRARTGHPKPFNYEEVLEFYDTKYQEIKKMCIKGTPGYLYYDGKR